MSHAEFLQRIAADREICGGRPCIRGTRIEVSIILDALAEGLTSEQIVEHYPHLSADDVRAAAAYAAKNGQDDVIRLIDQWYDEPDHQMMAYWDDLEADLRSDRAAFCYF